jgi:alkyl hydroperoxide reductase subunit AhpC
MDQFAQLRDEVKEFEKRQTQVLFVFPHEAALNRHWLRGRDQWTTLIPEFFGDSADNHPWLKSRGSGPQETQIPVLADPSQTMSADYGRALHAWGAFGNHPATFVIDREGVIRFVDFAQAAGKNGSNRPPAEQLLRVIDDLAKK